MVSKTKGSHKPRPRWVLVRDPLRLGKILSRALKGRSQRQVAEKLEIRQSLLSDVLNGKCRRLALGSLLKLRRACGKFWRDAEDAILSEGDRLALMLGQDWIVRSEGTEEAQLGLSLRERQILRCVAKAPKVRRAIDALEKVIWQRRHTVDRKLAAYRSVLEPLNRYYTTEGMEPGIHTLTEGQLGNYIYWGLKRERLLLENRETDRIQAQLASAETRARERRRAARKLGNAEARFSWSFKDAARLSAEETRLRTGASTLPI